MKNIDITKYIIPLLATCFIKEDFCDSSGFEGVYFHNAQDFYDINKYGVPNKVYVIFNRTLSEEVSFGRYARYAKDGSFLFAHEKVVGNKNCVVYEFNLQNVTFYQKLRETLMFMIDDGDIKIVENFWGVTFPENKKLLSVTTVNDVNLTFF